MSAAGASRSTVARGLAAVSPAAQDRRGGGSAARVDRVRVTVQQRVTAEQLLPRVDGGEVGGRELELLALGQEAHEVERHEAGERDALDVRADVELPQHLPVPGPSARAPCCGWSPLSSSRSRCRSRWRAGSTSARRAAAPPPRARPRSASTGRPGSSTGALRRGRWSCCRCWRTCRSRRPRPTLRRERRLGPASTPPIPPATPQLDERARFSYVEPARTCSSKADSKTAWVEESARVCDCERSAMSSTSLSRTAAVATRSDRRLAAARRGERQRVDEVSERQPRIAPHLREVEHVAEPERAGQARQ